MMTFVDMQQGWNALGLILSQPDFDPTVFMLEMAAKGYPHEFFQKNLLKDMLCELTMAAERESYRSRREEREVPCLRYSATAKDGTVVYGQPSFFSDIVDRTARFLKETPYFDKWLLKWRVTCKEEFARLLEESLAAWTKTSSFDYAKQYSPKLHPEYLEKLKPVMDGIIEKTKTLMEGERR